MMMEKTMMMEKQMMMFKQKQMMMNKEKQMMMAKQKLMMTIPHGAPLQVNSFSQTYCLSFLYHAQTTTLNYKAK